MNYLNVNNTKPTNKLTRTDLKNFYEAYKKDRKFKSGEMVLFSMGYGDYKEGIILKKLDKTTAYIGYIDQHSGRFETFVTGTFSLLKNPNEKINFILDQNTLNMYDGYSVGSCSSTKCDTEYPSY